MFILPPEDKAIVAVLSRTVALWGGAWGGTFRDVPYLSFTAGRARRGTGTRYYIGGVRALCGLQTAPSKKCRSDEEAVAWANAWAEKNGLASKLEAVNP